MLVSRRRHLLLASIPFAAALLTFACGRVVAPPPPSGAPGLSQDVVVAGNPTVVAARGARALYDISFVTKRFSSDSTWGWQPSDRIAARLRYTRPTRDSTRVLVELWGACGERCLAPFFGAIIGRIQAEEAPPQ